MARAVMDLIADDHCGLPRKRMEWIRDLNLASQTSGIMTSRRKAEPSIGATIASLIETCKLIGVEPHAYLADAISRIVNDHPNSQIGELLPWAYLATPERRRVA